MPNANGYQRQRVDETTTGRRQGSTAARHRPLILLVDDYEDALDIYGVYLQHTGFDVVFGRNGEEAVAAARAYRPDLILLDLRMPVMSGTDALHALRGDPTFASVPIVALTAHALEDERLRALAAGFNEVVTKPCLPDDLVVIVTRLLSGRESGAR
jgi:CheY-like chemotaxis protein